VVAVQLRRSDASSVRRHAHPVLRSPFSVRIIDAAHLVIVMRGGGILSKRCFADDTLYRCALGEKPIVERPVLWDPVREAYWTVGTVPACAGPTLLTFAESGISCRPLARGFAELFRSIYLRWNGHGSRYFLIVQSTRVTGSQGGASSACSTMPREGAEPTCSRLVSFDYGQPDRLDTLACLPGRGRLLYADGRVAVLGPPARGVNEITLHELGAGRGQFKAWATSRYARDPLPVTNGLCRDKNGR